MKKSLLAVAALTAFAGAAQAQSSVTVYGLLDAGLIGGNEQINGGKKGQVKQTGNAFGANAESTSRLGFKGTEDLGGGKSAFFTVEVALAPNGDQNYSTSASANRQTFVGLKQNGLGWGAFGTQYTNIHNQVGATDPGATNNVGGNVIYATSTLPGTSIGSGTNGNVDAYTLRIGNTLFLASDSFAGFQGNLAYTLNASSATETQNTPAGTGYTGGAVNKTGWQAGLNYTLSKFYATANYQSFNTKVSGIDLYKAPSQNNGESNGALSAQGATAAGTLLGFTNLADKQTYVAGTYDFGILKAYAQWIGRKVTQNSGQTATGAATSSSTQFNRNAQQIGVRSYVTPAIEAWASVGSGRFKGADSALGVAPATVNFTAYQIGSNYYLSKRTNLYAAFGSTTTSSGSVGTAGSGTSGNQYAIGARHTF